MRGLFALRWKKTIGFVLFLLLLVSGVGWWQHSPMMAWYALHGLAGASDADREAWIARVVALDDAAVPGLLECLERSDERACHSAQVALGRLVQHWTPEPPRCAALFLRLADVFPRLSMSGQHCVLELFTEHGAEVHVQAAIQVIPVASRAPDKAVRGRALALVAVLLTRPENGEALSACRELVRTSLQDQEAANRAEAVRLAMNPNIDLSRQVAPLLDDPSPEVRQGAMLAVGDPRHANAVATDDLLRSLHDPDADVRRLCEAALRGRGLRNDDVTMGRLITDARPTVRLQVLERLARADLEPGVWLRRLSQDPSPAVRAGAIRAAGESAQVDFADQLQNMAQHDPSSTVRQLAQFYLDRQRMKQR
ncbi:MAG: HEAT repeat domain-containing protein [Gemmataceae bacterium]|nr:HEAT repeat domain-containing protein [Gemmataceae bacterium]